jgi:HlyD family secretion protein
MPKLDSNISALLAAAVLAAGVGYGVHSWTQSSRNQAAQIASKSAVAAAGQSTDASTVTTAAIPKPGAERSRWAASAPGRVEPRDGEVRIGTAAAGRVEFVAVKSGSRVRAGDLLVQLDDEDARARIAGALAEVAVRRRERDAETVGKLASDRRAAEDQLQTAKRALVTARADRDRLLTTAGSSPEAIDKARAAVTAAREKLDQDRVALRRLNATTGMPLQTRLEASLSTARSELAVADAALERTRIRAPGDGTVLQINAKVGEVVAPSVELPVAVLGDLAKLRVRAEVEERDFAKLRVGQKAVIRSDAFPGQEFAGVVASMAQALAPPRLASRGPRRPNDVDVLEVMIDLDGEPPVLPGMRADVFFALDASAASPAGSKAN